MISSFAKRSTASIALGVAAATAISTTIVPSWPAQASVSAATAAAGLPVHCSGPGTAGRALAAKMSRDIGRSLGGRASAVGLDLTDNQTGVTCYYHSSWHFISASVVKVTILGALLRKAMEQHRALTTAQRNLAWQMITESSNNAASALWRQVGRTSLQHFLNLAGMKETELGPGGFWGLTEITAVDQVQLLRLITGPNAVLDQPSRIYARYLMDHVIASQRWGVPAGAPARVQVHVKNGWLPYPSHSDWRINSIGAFTTPKRIYLIAILTSGNPSMSYGIDTIEEAAVVIHRDLWPGTHSTVPESTAGRSWGHADEPVPPAGLAA